MKVLWLLPLLMLPLITWADCPEDNPDLTQTLSQPIGENGIIAMVKGTEVAKENEEGFLEAYIEVQQSYGLIIPQGKYLIAEENLWGNGCIFYQENIKFYNYDNKDKTIYLALSRVHGNTVVTPANEGNGLFVEDTRVFYKYVDDSLSYIEQAQFERNVLKGIPKKRWHRQ